MHNNSIAACLAVVIVGSVGLSLAAQTTAPAKTRQEQAREYQRLAEENIAKADKVKTESARGDLCVVQAELGDLSGAKKAADSLANKTFTRIDLAGIQARTDKKGALEYLHTIGSTWSSSPQELSAIGSEQATLGDIEGAQQLASSMKPSVYQVQLLCAIAFAQAKAGDAAEAAKTMSTAKSRFKSLAASGESGSIGQIAVAQMQAGDAAGAYQTADEVTASRDKAWMLLSFAHFIAAKGEKESARDMLEQSHKLTSKEPAIALLQLTELGKEYAAFGDAGMAKSILAEARGAAESQDAQIGRSSALSMVAAAQRACKDVVGAAETQQAALSALDQITDPSRRINALWTMARQQAESGDVSGAQHALALVTKLDTNPTNFSRQWVPVIVSALVRAGGPTVDLSWIAGLATPEDKACAYAAAAAALAGPSLEK